MISYSRLSACALLGPLHVKCNSGSMYNLPHVVNAVQANKFQIQNAIIPKAQLLPQRYFRALQAGVYLRL
jgi:hypothetical protein